MDADVGNGQRRRIVVAGDVTVDWKLIMPGDATDRSVAVSYLWEHSTAVAITAAGGGAALIAEIARAAAAGRAIEVDGPVVPDRVVTYPHDATYPRTYSVWSPFRRQSGAGEPAWRMTRFIGRDEAAVVAPLDDAPPGPVSTLILDDTNFGARDRGVEVLDSLPGAGDAGNVLLRMTTPIGQGALWNELIDRFADRLTVVVAINDLRKEHAPIGQALSWERTASEIQAAVRQRSDLTRAARVLVHVGFSGAVLIERDGPATLCYDPFHQEGDWERAMPGLPYGIGLCMIAALGVEATEHPKSPDWMTGITRGLAGGRRPAGGRGRLRSRRGGRWPDLAPLHAGRDRGGDARGR